AAALADHLLRHRLGDEQQPPYIDAELTVEVRFSEFGNRPHVEDAGVVDEDVDAAKFLENLRHHRLDRTAVAHVEPYCQGLAAEFGGKRFGLSRLHVGDADMGPPGGE